MILKSINTYTKKKDSVVIRNNPFAFTYFNFTSHSHLVVVNQNSQSTVESDFCVDRALAGDMAPAKLL